MKALGLSEGHNYQRFVSQQQEEPEGARHTGGWGEPRINAVDRLYDIIEAAMEIG